MAAEAQPPSRPGRRWHGPVVYTVLAVALVAAMIASSMIGQLPIHPTEVIGSVLRAIGIKTSWAPTDETIEATLWSIRFPRILMAVGVGAALAVSGAIMQAIFGNPLAEPGVVGVSSGAALGASMSIVFAWSFLGIWTTPVLAFLLGLLATLLVYYFSRSGGRTEVVTLLLTGVAINAFGGAGLALMTFMGDSQSREQIVFWQLGSLNGSRWYQALIVVGVTVAGTLMSLVIARQLDLLSLGERSAVHLGVNVERLRITGIIIVALLVGVGVSFVGIISFVGLVVPHIIRMVLGPAHRPLLVSSALGGAVLLLIADVGARTIVPYADLPIGMLTSLVGGPFFFYLLRRARRSSGGWA